MVIKLKEWIQGAVGLSITLTILFLCFAFFAVKLATRSHPSPYEQLETNVVDSTLIYRNSFGVPHVIGKSVQDVAFGQGFAHAQDRLWQMEAWRRLGRGTLAEVLGPQLVEPDLFMRSVGIAEIAKLQYAKSQPVSRKILQGYADGVNAYIESSKGNYSFEFDALDYSPEPWLPEDCLVVGRAMAFELSLAFWNDIAYAQIAAQRGVAAMKSYVPNELSAPYVLDTTSAGIPKHLDSLLNRSSADSTHAMIIDSLASSVRSGLTSVRTAMGIQGSGFGSNAWAAKKTSGGAIVASDPHLSVSMPSKWYQIHLTCPEFNSVGVSVPGIPLILSGRNDSLAWGFSNVMVDDVDYVVERIDSTNENYYFNQNGDRVKFTFRRDTVKIKGQPNRLVDYRFTERSCVISDFHAFKNPGWLFGINKGRSSKLLDATCLTFRWTARELSDEIFALYRMNVSNTLSQFKEATLTWYAPALNFCVGTKSGDVSTVLAGIIPMRGNSDPHLLAAAWDKAANWTGVIHLSTLGTLDNPARGFVVSANNNTLPKATPYIGSLFQSNSRAQRILDLLAIYKDYTVRDAQLMQMDQISPFARRFVAQILPYLKKGLSKYSPSQKEALNRLKMWDGTESPVDPSTAIYAVMLQRMIVNTFEDELGTPLFQDWTFLASNGFRKLDELLRQPQHILFDDVRTESKENLQWIAVRSFMESVDQLTSRFRSSSPKDWKYGQMHTVTFPHLFGKHPLMKPVLDLGPFEIGGGPTTINNTEWSIHKPFETNVVASVRVISDLHDSLQYSVVPGGVSGQPLHPHYSDQMQLWLKGGYVRIPCSPKPHITFRLYQVLLPKRG